jgi:hypothetical protein
MECKPEDGNYPESGHTRLGIEQEIEKILECFRMIEPRLRTLGEFPGEIAGY